MKKYRKQKFGFTLLEMVLVLAIICMLGGIVGGLCLAISNSFLTTYNIDDSSDYALLFARGFENSFLAKTQKGGAANNIITWKVAVNPSDNYPTLRVTDAAGESAVFEPHYMGGANGVYKWDIRMFYKWDPASERVLYCILLKDNKNGTDFLNFYQGGFWVPRFTDRKAYNQSTCSISTGGTEMTGPYLNTIGFNSAQIPSNLLSEHYWSEITYTF